MLPTALCSLLLPCGSSLLVGVQDVEALLPEGATDDDAGVNALCAQSYFHNSSKSWLQATMCAAATRLE